MSDNQKHEQRRFAIEGIKNTGFSFEKHNKNLIIR